MSLVNEKVNKQQDTRKKYCRFKKNGIQYIDYKDGNFLLKFVNEQGKLLPRRLTGTSLKFQRPAEALAQRDRPRRAHSPRLLVGRTDGLLHILVAGITIQVILP